VLNRTQKYVASRTLDEPLPWENSTLLEGDAAAAVSKLKDETEHLSVLGSGELVGELMCRGLVDEFLLLIHPLVLGTGRRLFPDGASAQLELADSLTTTTGVVIGTYRAVQAPGGGS
jgi:dihydrofolate reductase